MIAPLDGMWANAMGVPKLKPCNGSRVIMLFLRCGAGEGTSNGSSSKRICPVILFYQDAIYTYVYKYKPFNVKAQPLHSATRTRSASTEPTT